MPDGVVIPLDHLQQMNEGGVTLHGVGAWSRYAVNRSRARSVPVGPVAKGKLRGLAGDMTRPRWQIVRQVGASGESRPGRVGSAASESELEDSWTGVCPTVGEDLAQHLAERVKRFWADGELDLHEGHVQVEVVERLRS